MIHTHTQSPRTHTSGAKEQPRATLKFIPLVASLAILFLVISFFTPTAAHAASPNESNTEITNETDSAIQELNSLNIGVSARGVIIGGNKFIKVCAPKKCKTVPKAKVCTVGSGCGKAIYKEYKGYCSPTVGCFSYKGKNYIYTGFKPTAAQLSQARKCAAGIGVTWLGAIAGGPIGVTILGVPVALWSCG